MDFSTVNEWLNWIASIHTKEIDLGLDRVKAVADKLEVLTFSCPIIIVGGTNGKGSTVAGLEAVYQAAGYHTGTFTSPMLYQPNEQVRIGGQMVTDEILCLAFARVAAARGEVSLTPFEFFTLAALSIFKDQSLDVLILEVGLGGRLDAVNIMDADVSVITTIAMDHMDYLGTTRDAIAMEKAGIFRSGRPAVCGDDNPPPVVTAIAETLGTPLFCQGKDFYYQETSTGWSWFCDRVKYIDLAFGALARQNLSTVLMVTTLLQDRLPVDESVIRRAVANAALSGRIEVVAGEVTHIYDVSHNPASAAHLAKYLQKHPVAGKTYAVFSMLGDKDIEETISVIRNEIDHWYVAPLQCARAASSVQLLQTFESLEIHRMSLFKTIQAAYDDALQTAKVGDRMVIFGSFHTVADVRRHNHKK